MIRQHSTALPVKAATDLVEQQDVGPLQGEHCEGDARLLTSGQRTDRLETMNNLVSIDLAHMLSANLPSHAADLEVTQVSTVFLLRPAWELGCEELHRRHVWDQVVDVMLSEVTTVIVNSGLDSSAPISRF